MGQIYAVSACLLAGIAAGLCCEPFAAVSALTRERARAVSVLSDILYGVAAAAAFVCIATAFSLPDLRFYMLFFCGLGFLLWNRSFHRILAFWSKKLYNAYRSSCRRGLMRLYKAICRKRSSKKSSLAQRLPQ